MTLNQYAARIAGLINQPYNHELLERIKDMVKTVFANRIRQSVERNGIDDVLKLSFVVPVEEIDYTEILNYPYQLPYDKKVLITSNKVPVPIRIKNDSPFTYVGTINGKSYSYARETESRYLHTLFPTGGFTSYYIKDNKIIINFKKYSDEVELTPPTEILIEGIFENPEEVIGMYLNQDDQDYELPFPNDMLEDIIYQILKTEFNMMPKDISVQINKDNTPVNG